MEHQKDDRVEAEVAFLLGYAEPAAFHHAFRRWTDQTSQQWRAARSA